MAPRVTDVEVKQIIEVNPSLIPTTDPFILTATTLVDELLLTLGYSDPMLKQIELYLSAHFTAMKQRQLDSEDFGDSENSYIGEVGKGLDFTQYGQQAKILDFEGGLADAGKPKAQLQVFSVLDC